jgi:hypothetical protein
MPIKQMATKINPNFVRTGPGPSFLLFLLFWEGIPNIKRFRTNAFNLLDPIGNIFNVKPELNVNFVLFLLGVDQCLFGFLFHKK